MAARTHFWIPSHIKNLQSQLWMICSLRSHHLPGRLFSPWQMVLIENLNSLTDLTAQEDYSVFMSMVGYEADSQLTMAESTDLMSSDLAACREGYMFQLKCSAIRGILLLQHLTKDIVKDRQPLRHWYKFIAI